MEYKTDIAILDYIQDWSDWLATGDTISLSTWTLEAGITSDSNSNTTTTATINISGGVLGKTYKVSNEITTANGFKSVRVWYLRIQDLTI